MKRRRVARVLDLPWAVWVPGLLVLGVCFLLGTVAGCLWAGGVAENGGETLAAYIEGYLSAARSGTLTVPSVFSVLYESFRWPVLTVLLAFTAAGVLGIPILFAVRGFLLSFAVASFVRVLGGAGSILAFLLFGLTGLMTVPVLFVLGTQGFTACCVLASRLLGERRKSVCVVYGRVYFLRCGLCAAALLFCVFLEQTIVPSLLAVLAGTF